MAVRNRRTFRERSLLREEPKESHGKKIFRELLGILLVALAVLSIVSLAGYYSGDPSFNQYLESKPRPTVRNYAGIIGAYVADGWVQSTGGLAYLGIGFLLIFSWGFIRGRKAGFFLRYTAIGFLLAVSCGTLLALWFPEDPFFKAGVKPGGAFGFSIASFLEKYLNKAGSYILLLTLFFLALITATRVSINATLEVIKKAVLVLFRIIQHLAIATWEVMKDIFATGSERFGELAAEKKEEWKEWAAKRAEEREREDGEEEALEEGMEGEEPLHAPEPEDEDEPDEEMHQKIDALEGVPKIVRSRGDDPEAPSSEGKKEILQEPFPFLAKLGKYKIPPVTLLEPPPPKEEFKKKNEAELLTNAKILEKKLEAFGVQGKVAQVLPGPVITMYEYEPASGVKVSKIANLSDDLALSMRAVTVRILAPVPGKAVVGIEIPNLHRETVYLREVLSSDLYQNTKSKLTIAIGHDTTGNPVVADLAQIPHLLVAGSTGSGKSVGVNGMICSILLKAKPDEVKFIMIDPKMLELSVYDGIPHLISPVVTDPKKAASALRWAVEEMERRYKLLSEQGVRHIAGYNRLVKENKKKKDDETDGDEEELLFKSLGEKDDDLKDQFKDESLDADQEEIVPVEPPTEKLPYIVIIIDELADLMMTSPKDVEFCIARIAQMARAAGIHMIVATQRPSVDVITGLIKANFPARVAYKVASRVDSRTILDHMGAEKLLGKGDLLFCPPGTSKLERIHGCWVSDMEVKRIVDHLKRQQKPTYIKDILKMKVEEKEEEGSEDPDALDPMYDQAVELVTSTQMASISMVQRKLRIGYNRAARLIEQMEKEGIVGPSDGVKQREVYAREL